MKIDHFTAIIEKSEDGWYVGQLEEMPEVLSQGKTISELMDNLKDAFKLMITSQKKETLKKYEGRKFIKRHLSFAK